MQRSVSAWSLVIAATAACGPAVVDGASTGDGTGEAITAGSSAPSTSGGLDGVAATSGASDDDTGDGTTTGVDPTGPCPAPRTGVTYLWCGDVLERSALATDGAWVYFGTEGGGLWRASVDGSEAEALVGDVGDLFSLEVFDGALYWTSFFRGEVGRKVLPDGPTQILADDLFKPGSIAVRGELAFVTQYGDGLPLVKIALASGEVSPLYEGLDHAGFAFVDGDALYFATGTNASIHPTPLHRGTVDGDPAQTVMTRNVTFVDIDQEGQQLWWTSYQVEQKDIMLTPLDDPEATVSLFETTAYPLALALTPQRVFWVEVEARDGVAIEGRLRSISRDGGDDQTHVTNPRELGGVVQTAAGIVFVQPGAIGRLD